MRSSVRHSKPAVGLAGLAVAHAHLTAGEKPASERRDRLLMHRPAGCGQGWIGRYGPLRPAMSWDGVSGLR
jgi:hypothetical protein